MYLLYKGWGNVISYFKNIVDGQFGNAIKFIVIFCFLYFGTLFLEGCGTPGGLFYFPWVYKHFYYLDGLRDLYLRISFDLLELLGFHPVRITQKILRIGSSGGINLNNACLAYGIFSFWIAFTLSDNTRFKKKTLWLLTGVCCLFVLNIIRICLILIAGSRHWITVNSLDHHQMFNVATYIIIGVLIFFYWRSNSKVLLNSD